MKPLCRHPYRRENFRLRKWIPAVLIVGFLTGCATAPQTPKPSLNDAIGLAPGTPVTIGVLEADITLRELSAGGTPQERDDWSEIAQQTARDTLETMRPERFVYYGDQDLPDDVKAEIEDVQALFRNTILNDMAFTPPPTRSRPRFGSVDTIAAAGGADALMMVYGVDDIFTADRKVLTALSLVAAGLTGVAVMPDSGVAHLNAALISREGRLIWYSRIYENQISDLRTTDGVRKTLENLLRTMPMTKTPDETAPQT
jgi:hypothetical protein